MDEQGIIDHLKKTVLAVEPLSANDQRQLVIRWQDDADEAARILLTESNARLVFFLAAKFRSKYPAISFLDFYQEGMIGLLHAMGTYDRMRPNTFATHAGNKIRGVIKALLVNQGFRVARLTTTGGKRKLFFNFDKTIIRLEQQGLVPTDSMIARFLNIKVSDVTSYRAGVAFPLELDVEMRDKEGKKSTRRDTLPQTGVVSAEERASVQEQQDIITMTMDEFRQILVDDGDERDLYIWDHRMVAMEEDVSTLKNLGEHFDVSRTRIQQLEAKLKKRLTEMCGDMGFDLLLQF